MAEVFSTMFQDEALVVRSLLQSTDIQAEIAGEHLIEVYPLFFPESGGIRILVPDDQEEDACVLIAEYLERKDSGRSVPTENPADEILP